MARRVNRMLAAAPAKVNLILRILGRRADGYHLLESLLVPISLCDVLDLRVARGLHEHRSRVRCRVSGREKIEGGADNLAARAASAVLDELGVHADVDIRLKKMIPVGAGLGGGSSDAAAVLKALPRLLGRRIPAVRLSALALGLGADVPFFLDCRPAWAQGIGEILHPLADFPRVGLVVVVPRRRVATAWAYAHATPALNRRRRAHRAPSLRGAAESLSCRVSNDFEEGVGAVVPDVGRLKRGLETLGAMATVMSGSGSAVVGVFASSAAAKTAARAFRGPDRAWAVQALRRRPRMDA